MFPLLPQGSFENLRLIRAAGVQCPLLCKEFIVEAYQVFKGRARCGATGRAGQGRAGQGRVGRAG